MVDMGIGKGEDLGLRLLEQAPLGQLVQGIATAIAEAQFKMDQFALQTLEWYLDERAHGIRLPQERRPRSLIELGFVPSFYHFSETTITAKVTFSVTTSEAFEAGAEIGAGYKGIFFASVNASYSNKYSFTADGSSEVKTTIVSIPLPGPLHDILMERVAKEQAENKLRS